MIIVLYFSIKEFSMEVDLQMNISRKKFLKDAFKYVAGGFAAISATNIILSYESDAKIKKVCWPWPYKYLDPERSRKLAHECYYKHGCGYAGFTGIIKLLKEKIGEPYTLLPLEMMAYGGRGVRGWGTICETLNGASAAISLVCNLQESNLIINELIGWYTNALLPTDISNHYAEEHQFTVNKNIKALPQNKSGSPLCHISVTKWCNSSGYSVGSPEQQERCARIGGDVAAKAVNLLNAQKNNRFQVEYILPEATKDCLSCHGKDKEVGNVDTKMQCLQCHGEAHKNNTGTHKNSL